MGGSISTSDLVRKNGKTQFRVKKSISTDELDLHKRKLKFYKPEEVRYLHQVMPSGIWRGRRCFLIGGGPSIKGFDFSQLAGEMVITINRGFENFPDAVINLCQDARVWGWYECGDLGQEAKEKFEKFQGMKVWLDVQRFPYPEDVRIIRTCNQYDFNYREYEGGIPPWGNSGLNALCLAVCLGASPIYLLGFDCRGKDGKTANYHAGYPDSHKEEIYKTFVRDFNDASVGLNPQSQIVNLNRNSAIRCFKFGDFSEIKKISRPLYVAYFTKGTGYEREVERLHKSLHFWGLEHELIGIEDLGSWRKNIHARIQVLRNALDRFGRDIVYIDADGAVIHYPDQLDGIEEDFAAVWLDREKYFPDIWKQSWCNEPPAGKWEVLGGTMFFKNNARARAMLDAWERLDAPMATHLSQVHLVKAIESVPGLKIKKLPDGYCQIFDIMAGAGEPVIEHYQASRRSLLKVNANGGAREFIPS